MNIAVIGIGNVGSALGGSLARAGHQVTFAARDAARAQEVAAATGSTAGTPAAAVSESEVVVLAVPYGATTEVADAIRAGAEGKVVIDVRNPIRADYSGLSTSDASAGEELAAALPGARVVKAFNTVFAGNQADPAGQGTALDALYATDDPAAGETVAQLASSIGFRPVNVGPLAAARELEALAWLNIRLQLLAQGSWQSAWVLVAPPAAAVTA